MFTACRYLRDMGFDARLFTLEDEAEHFSPEADSYSDDFNSYVFKLPVSKSTLLYIDKGKVRNMVAGFDFYMGTDIAPAFMECLGMELDVFVPHGSDIYSYPFVSKREKIVDKIWWLKEIFFISKMQFAGISSCKHIIFPDEYEVNFPYRNKLKTNAIFYNFSLPMLYLPQYQENNLEFLKELEFYNAFNKIRHNNSLVVFSHARQNGKNLPLHLSVHEKGNDILITGFAKFIQENSSVKACLVLFDYGMDVDAAKRLVKELGIESKVIWMPKMYRKEIMYGLKNSDVGCGQFINSWLTCGVVNETLALGKPLLHYRNDALYEKNMEWLYPVLNSHTADEVYDALKDFASNREKHEAIAAKGIEWIEEFTVKIPFACLTSIIENRNVNRGFENKGSFARAIIKLNVKLKIVLAKLGM